MATGDDYTRDGSPANGDAAATYDTIRRERDAAIARAELAEVRLERLRVRDAHWDGCWRYAGHYICAVAMVEELQKSAQAWLDEADQRLALLSDMTDRAETAGAALAAVPIDALRHWWTDDFAIATADDDAAAIDAWLAALPAPAVQP